MQSVTAANDIAGRGRLITVVVLIVGIILAVTFGFLLTYLITKPMFKGVDLAKVMTGEAGKGLLWSPMKSWELAKQTAGATLNIKNKIQDIQQATGVTVKEINETSAVIAKFKI